MATGENRAPHLPTPVPSPCWANLSRSDSPIPTLGQADLAGREGRCHRAPGLAPWCPH